MLSLLSALLRVSAAEAAGQKQSNWEDATRLSLGEARAAAPDLLQRLRSKSQPTWQPSLTNNKEDTRRTATGEINEVKTAAGAELVKSGDEGRRSNVTFHRK